MAIDTQKYIRKPLYVDAVRVTEANFYEIADWCQGLVEQESSTNQPPSQTSGKKYIKVRVHNPKNIRQSKAYVGDWLLYTERGYKVYTNKAFHAAFDRVDPDSDLPHHGITVGGEAELSQSMEDENRFPGMRGKEYHDFQREPPTPTVESEPEQEKVEPAAVEGKRVLSIIEQRELSQDEIRDLVQSGEAVLVQDIAQA